MEKNEAKLLFNAVLLRQQAKKEEILFKIQTCLNKDNNDNTVKELDKLFKKIAAQEIAIEATGVYYKAKLNKEKK